MVKEVLAFAQKGVVLNKRRNAILVSRYLTSKYLPDKLVNKLCLPGGQLEFGQDVDKSFIAEVQEETGIVITPHVPFYLWTWVYQKDKTSKQIIAVARIGFYSGGQIKPPPKEKETTIDIAKWVRITDLPTMVSEFVIDEQPAIEKFLKHRSRLLV